MERELLYKKIYDDLIAGIQNGTYPAGSRLPSEKELMEQYGVSRITSKKALEMLADRNVIIRMPGKGSYVLEDERDDVECVRMTEPSLEHENKHKLIGVVLDSFGAIFGCDLVVGMERECRMKNYSMVLKCTYGNMEEEKKAIEELIGLGVEGIILMCTQGETYNPDIIKLSVENFPLILVDRELKGLPIPYVGTDNYNATKELISLLVEEGHSNICFLSHASMQTSSVVERFQGYRDALMDYTIVSNEDMWITDLNFSLPSLDEKQEAENEEMNTIEKYLEMHPDVTAFFAVEESIGVMVYRVLQKLGLEKQKEIVYFDGIEERFDFSSNFAHVMQGQYLMGAVSVRRLHDRINGKEVKSHQYIPYTIVRKK